MYDLIGDVHGHADELVQLLQKLDYQKVRGAYRHPDRQVIFLGDFIDRGPKIREVLEIVRPMVDERTALAVMGNHELNALAYHTEDLESPGEFLRRRTTEKVKQHSQTVAQLTPPELRQYLDWFRTLPMWLDLEKLRAVHACWDERSIASVSQAIEKHRGITPSFLHSACKDGKELFAPVEVILKGKEASLPEGLFFIDKNGDTRTELRTRWYKSAEGETYRTYGLHSDEIDCSHKLTKEVVEAASPYPATAKPVFVGHYWLSADRPEILADNVACLDFSVAKGGFLCAYRWNGEQKLSNDNFAWVSAKD